MTLRTLFGRWRGPLGPWTLAAQVLVGLFFVAAAYHKVFIYFIDGRSIMDDFAYWESSDFPPHWYRWFVHAIDALPYGSRFMEISVIGSQGVAGALLAFNRRTRIAGWLLLFVQANVFLGTFHHRGFNEFVGVSLVTALVFVLRNASGRFSPAAWRAVTWSMASVTALYLYNRGVMGDPWTESFAWQRLDLQQDVMSTTWAWKASALWLADLPFGAYLWAAPWWISIALTGLLFTRLRPYACAGLLLFAILRTLTWTNSITSQGVVFVLLYFLWLATDRENAHSAR